MGYAVNWQERHGRSFAFSASDIRSQGVLAQAAYEAKSEPQFQEPYIDIETCRHGVNFHFIHGGFKGPEL
jgi:hypothetical protein